jgi:Na+/melibiose symporter-like transporter
MGKLKVKGDDLTKKNIYSYGIGHFMNDLCASCWFYFLSYYLIEILKLGESSAGYVMLSGQVADAIATPLVGILSDKTNTRIGKRTPWYIGGTILVTVSFALIFIKVIPDDIDESWRFIYYLTFPALFNIGWAAVQVSHMALCPALSLNKKNKELMVRVRTGFTFLAQTATLVISFLLFWLVPDKLFQYELLSGICLVLGIITTIFFLVYCKEHELTKNIPAYRETMRITLETCKEEELEKEQSEFGGERNPLPPHQPLIEETIVEKRKEPFIHNDNDIKGEAIVSIDNNTEIQSKPKEQEINWLFWMKKPDYYTYMLVYMFIRLSINVTCTVIPFYLEYILKYHKTADNGTPIEFSIVMLISTIGSIFSSSVIQVILEKKIKPDQRRKIIMLIATITVAIGCAPIYFLTEEFRIPIFFLAFIFGIGFSLGLSTASSLTNDVVGSKGTQGAFVYGSFSFADKLSCGLVLAFFLPLIKENQNILIYTMSILPPTSLLIGMLIVFCRAKVEKNRKGQSSKDLHKSIIDNSRFTFIKN